MTGVQDNPSVAVQKDTCGLQTNIPRLLCGDSHEDPQDGSTRRGV